jgi:hypothetical protein
MPTAKAVYHAIDLLHRPVLAKVMQEQPLPPDTLALLKIVGGDRAALEVASHAAGMSCGRIRQASILYVDRVLFFPGASHYRLFGADVDATQEDLRERFVWLMRWLHPDKTAQGWESAFAARVVAAWNDLKTPQRRRHYDATLAARSSSQERTPRHTAALVALPRMPWISGPAKARSHRRRHLGLLAVVAAVVASTLLVPDASIVPQGVSASGDHAPAVETSHGP